MFTFCPTCKNNLEINGNNYHCLVCGFDYYFNANPAVGVIIKNKNSQIYLGLRKREPGSGKWGLPGGFINLHESAEDGAIREIKEELNIDLDNLTFFKSVPNDYFYKGTQYYPLDLFFISKTNLDEIKLLNNEELSDGKFFNINEIPFDDLAFESNRKTLLDYLNFEKNKNN